MTVNRRQVLTAGTAGVGLAVAGVLPSLTGSTPAFAHDPHPPAGGSGGRPFPP